MSLQKLRVMVAASSSYWVVGNVPLKGERLQDVLKDGCSDFVTLSDVHVHRYVTRQCTARVAELVVPKGKIVMVVASSSQHEAPLKRWNNFTTNTTANVFAIVHEYQVHGELHMPTRSSDPQYMLTHSLGRFFPLSRASISGPGIDRLDVPLLFANREFVNGFHLAGAENAPEATRDTATPPPRDSNNVEEDLESLVESLRDLDISPDRQSTESTSTPSVQE